MSDEIQELKALIKLMNDNDLLELEITKEGRKIRLKKKYEGVRKEILTMPSMQSAAFGGDGGGGGPSPQQVEAAGMVTVRSPMVGSFYRRSTPEADPYVDIGHEVNEGDVLCLIEAMKVFNEIKAQVSGEIVDIICSDGEPVEYNQPLFIIKPR